AFKFLRDLNLNENVRRSSTYQSNDKLTDRQSIIAVEMANGSSNREIAAKIGYSESLVRQETIQIYKALQIVGRTELVANPNLIGNSKTEN
ncbi:MAG: LuxR C-terminal-related transcriptional regulator, partial [Actinobacteria bacterium]|nr:LuxR C-terminal-related transcriptional regulator [Actinomycetota bacterium]